MPPLTETNPWLRDPEMRRYLNERSARESSIFEGARGLPQPQAPPAYSPVTTRKRRSNASSKKTRNAS
jgi:hypothetical protein